MNRKKLATITDFPKVDKHLLFIDEENDDLELRDVQVRRSMFVRMGMKRAKLQGSQFLHCIFDDCYLREAEFVNVDFTGSFFKDCNLERAKFHSCSLRYTRFQRCLVNVEEILGSLPTEPNLKHQVLCSLIQNAMEMGQKKVADKLITESIRAEREELKNQFLARTSYYKKRYNLFDRVLSFGRLTVLFLSGLIWGYGLKIHRLIISGFSFILLIALIMTIFALPYCQPGQNVHSVLSFREAIYVSALTFGTIGFGGYTPAATSSQVVSVVESLVGAVFIGFLAASVYRRIAR